jgi:hypothetical protein
MKQHRKPEPGKCPDCNAPLRIKWSGVECSRNCGYWFCY